MTKHNVFKSRQHCTALFVQDRQVAWSISIGNRSLLIAETTRDLFLLFVHSHVAFDQIVVNKGTRNRSRSARWHPSHSAAMSTDCLLRSAYSVPISPERLESFDLPALVSKFPTTSCSFVENPISKQNFLTSFGMGRVMDKRAYQCYTHRVLLACYIEFGFVLTQPHSLRQPIFDLHLERLQVQKTLLHPILWITQLNRLSKQMHEKIKHSLVRLQQLNLQIHCKPCAGKTTLDWELHLSSKGSSGDMSGRIALAFGLIFRHLDMLRWHLNHLKTLHHFILDVPQVMLTHLTVLNTMYDELIEHHHLFEHISLMSAYLPTYPPQVLGLPMKAIRRREQVTIVAIFAKLYLQLTKWFGLALQLQLCYQSVTLGYLLLQLLDDLRQHFYLFFSSRSLTLPTFAPL